MKYRHGHVSNSSSSSFVLDVGAISGLQLSQILDHATIGKKLGIPWAGSDAWSVTVEGNTLSGSTSMDNFDMHQFLTAIGVPEDAVRWDEDDPWER